MLSKPRAQSLLRAISGTSILVWTLLGFSASYLLFFIGPVFFSAPAMQFVRYVPAADHVGLDLRYVLSFCESWAVTGQTPYIGQVGFNDYPPLATVLFTPLLSMQPSLAYRAVTLTSILCYVLVAYMYSLRAVKNRQAPSLLALVFIAGLFSYGFQFELERGQFNVIAASLSLLAVWIYHYRNRYRHLAYLLFTISVQLKVYPLIYILMLTNDWRDWRDNIKRLVGLGVLNLASLFVLGPQAFIDFVRGIRVQIAHPYVWVGNHSIRSFVTWAAEIASQHDWDRVAGHSELLQLALLTVVAVCMLSLLLQAYRQGQTVMNPYVLLACTIAALLIPSLSHDYKLAILATPFAVALSEVSSLFEQVSGRRKFALIALTLVLSAAYSSTLFSFVNKPFVLGNNLPALFAMLLAVTCLSLVYGLADDVNRRPLRVVRSPHLAADESPVGETTS